MPSSLRSSTTMFEEADSTLSQHCSEPTLHWLTGGVGVTVTVVVVVFEGCGVAMATARIAKKKTNFIRTDGIFILIEGDDVKKH